MTAWNDKKILFVGETVLDVIQILSTYPKEDADVRSRQGWWQRGGNASNNCTVTSLLGEKCELLSTFSTSDLFKFVINDLDAHGIDYKNCIYYPNCEVPLSTIWLSEETGSRTIVHSNPNLPHMNFYGFDKCNLSEYKWIHFEVGWGRNPHEFRRMMDKARRYDPHIQISVELEKMRGDDLHLVEVADYVIMGRTFAEFLGWKSKDEAVYKIKELSARKNFTVICPWGSDGVSVLDNRDNFYSCPSYPPEKIVDSLGAGDTFTAATIFALNKGKHIKDAVDFGSKIAGAKIGFYGYKGIKDIHKQFL